MKLRSLFPEAIKSRLRPLMVLAARRRDAQTAADLSSLLQESYWREELQALDHACRVSAAEAALRPLIEALPLELFLLLVFTRQTAWPNIARWFPSLPSAELQERFTGRSNQAHLNTVNWFVAAVAERYERQGGRINDATVLDVGCGWGRFMRAFWRYVPADRLHGMDVNGEILKSCDEHRVPGRRYLGPGFSAPEIPSSFSLIYAYSVFTHLEEQTHLELLAQLRNVITDNGLLVLTIRADSYWNRLMIARPAQADRWRKLKNDHRQHGYAFGAHGGRPTFGETSIDPGYIDKFWSGWRVEGFGYVPAEPYQIVVWLRPASS
jgi:predicted TPR repeat methyltransferase